MSDSKSSVEIDCPACGRRALLVRKPRYDGFTRVGETLICAACGHRFADESEITFVEERDQPVFTEEDRPEAVRVFDENDKPRFCLHCRHYVVNPFTQWCGVHKREVEATDSCKAFEQKEDTKAADDEKSN